MALALLKVWPKILFDFSFEIKWSTCKRVKFMQVWSWGVACGWVSVFVSVGNLHVSQAWDGAADSISINPLCYTTLLAKRSLRSDKQCSRSVPVKLIWKLVAGWMSLLLSLYCRTWTEYIPLRFRFNLHDYYSIVIALRESKKNQLCTNFRMAKYPWCVYQHNNVKVETLHLSLYIAPCIVIIVAKNFKTERVLKCFVSLKSQKAKVYKTFHNGNRDRYLKLGLGVSYLAKAYGI